MSRSRSRLIGETWRLVRESGKVSIIAFVVFLVLMGVVIVLVERAAIMPFIYTRF